MIFYPLEPMLWFFIFFIIFIISVLLARGNLFWTILSALIVCVLVVVTWVVLSLLLNTGVITCDKLLTLKMGGCV